MTEEAPATLGEVNSNDVVEQSTPDHTKTHCKRRCFAWAALLLLFVIAAGVAFGTYYLVTMQRGVAANTTEIKKLQVGLAYSQDQQSTQQRQLAAQTEQISGINEHLGFNQTKWQLAESHYLLKLAHFNLQYQENSRIALQLAEMASSILNKIELTELQTIRNQLSDSIYQLKSIQASDLAAILARLNTLQTNAIQLELPKPSTQEENGQKSASTTQHKAHNDWRDHFQSTLSELKDMVVIRYHEKPINAQQLPLNRGYLREQLAVLLTQAEWAVMRNEQHLYQNTVKQAKSWIQEYFDTSNSNVQTFMQALEQLQHVSVTSSRYPDFGPVIDEINSILQQQETTTVTQSNETDKAIQDVEDEGRA